MSQASKKGKIVKFTDSTCDILSKSHKLIVKATKRGSLYKLNCSFNTERVHFASGPIIRYLASKIWSSGITKSTENSKREAGERF